MEKDKTLIGKELVAKLENISLADLKYVEKDLSIRDKVNSKVSTKKSPTLKRHSVCAGFIGISSLRS